MFPFDDVIMIQLGGVYIGFENIKTKISSRKGFSDRSEIWQAPRQLPVEFQSDSIITTSMSQESFIESKCLYKEHERIIWPKTV